jgi:hypothetical protein
MIFGQQMGILVIGRKRFLERIGEHLDLGHGFSPELKLSTTILGGFGLVV